MFGGSEDKMEKRLQEEKGYIWQEINKISSQLSEQQKSLDSLSKNAPEHFKELQKSAKDASYYKNRAEEQLKSVETSVAQVNAIKINVETIESNTKENSEYIVEQKEKAKTSLLNIDEYKEEINKSKDTIANTFEI